MSHVTFVGSVFETVLLSVAQASLKLTALLLQSPKGWISFLACATTLSLSQLLKFSALFSSSAQRGLTRALTSEECRED